MRFMCILLGKLQFDGKSSLAARPLCPTNSESAKLAIYPWQLLILLRQRLASDL